MHNSVYLLILSGKLINRSPLHTQKPGGEFSASYVSGGKYNKITLGFRLLVLFIFLFFYNNST